MWVELSIKSSVKDVFSDYEEKFVGNSIVFEGCLLPHKIEARDEQVIRFVSGGRKYLSYELERDGAYVKGVIRYRPMPLPKPKSIESCIAKIEAAIGKAPSTRDKRRAADDDQVDKIRLLHDKGVSQRAIARYFGIHYSTISKIINKKGVYAEE